MNDIAIYTFSGAAFIVFILLMMRSGKHSGESSAALRRQTDPSLGNVRPKHYHFFPQVRQALSNVDHEYLLETAPAHVARQAIRQRREVAKRFLFGLREDFSKLERLSRMISALSPVISREQETERLFLSLQFRMLFSLVWLRLSVGRIPLPQMEQLTGMVGKLAVRMELAMSQINALSVEQLPRGISA